MLNLIKDLQESLIYKMSLESKELYHSNVWAWLIDMEPNFVKAFKTDVPHDLELVQVTREQKNMDLILWYGQRKGKRITKVNAIVIENKLKAIPNKEQLNKYQSNLGKKFYKGILTGFMEPSFKLPNGWEFISYSELTNSMFEILESSSITLINKNRLIINEYLHNNKKMEEIVNYYVEKDKYSLRINNPKELNSIGLQDLVNKITGSLLVNYLDNRLKKDNINDGVILSQAFHHKSPTIDVRIHHADDKVNYLIQIEGFEYRRFIWREEYSGTAKDIFDEFVKEGFFTDDFKAGDKYINFSKNPLEKRKTRMKKKYCSYNNNCVYQYFDIDMNTSFEKIYEWILSDVLVMKELSARRP